MDTNTHNAHVMVWLLKNGFQAPFSLSGTSDIANSDWQQGMWDYGL
jgi:hypothetical protein